METDILPIIRDRITEQKSSIEQFLARGMAKTFDDYHRMVGEYAALEKIEQELLDIERKYIES